jgi:hypothetical protein
MPKHQIQRRPYNDCSWAWGITVQGIDYGHGKVFTELCLGINGSFVLQHKPCSSTAEILVWTANCEVPGFLEERDYAECGQWVIDVAGVSGFDCADSYNGHFTFKLYPPAYISSPSIEPVECDVCAYEAPSAFIDMGEFAPLVNYVDGAPVCVPQAFMSEMEGHWLPDNNFYMKGAWSFYGDRAEECGSSHPYELRMHQGTGPWPVYERDRVKLPTGLGDTVIFHRTQAGSFGSWPATITMTRVSEYVPPEVVFIETPNERTRTLWFLEYAIESATWTLSTLPVIKNVVYQLVDTEPCEGIDKILSAVASLSDSEVDICSQLPSQVRLRRLCPPDRKDEKIRRQNKRTGVLARQCGCDCQDYPIDYRWIVSDERVPVDDRLNKYRQDTFFAVRYGFHKCTSDCGSQYCIDACTFADDEISGDPDTRYPRKCRFPRPQNWCCENEDPPCAYIVFDCALQFEGIPIGAESTVLRQICRFDDPCKWYAIGQSWQPKDGMLGSQPLCAICGADRFGTDMTNIDSNASSTWVTDCESGCTWLGWTEAICMPDGTKIPVATDVAIGANNPLKGSTLDQPKLYQVYGTSWEINITTPDQATLFFNHPNFGYLLYQVDEMEPWRCDAVNTMKLMSQGNLPDLVLPATVCVIPWYESCPGDLRYDVLSDKYKLSTLAQACCDPACYNREWCVQVECCNQKAQTCVFVSTTDENDPNYNPYGLTAKNGVVGGLTYMAIATVLGVEIAQMIYCDGMSWWVDTYCGVNQLLPNQNPINLEYIDSKNFSPLSRCCPLVLTDIKRPYSLVSEPLCCPNCTCCDYPDTLTLTMKYYKAGGCQNIWTYPHSPGCDCGGSTSEPLPNEDVVVILRKVSCIADQEVPYGCSGGTCGWQGSIPGCGEPNHFWSADFGFSCTTTFNGDMPNDVLGVSHYGLDIVWGPETTGFGCCDRRGVDGELINVEFIMPDADNLTLPYGQQWGSDLQNKYGNQQGDKHPYNAADCPAILKNYGRGYTRWASPENSANLVECLLFESITVSSN